MTSKDRRTREKLGTREKILNAARELFVEQGFDAVTMRKVAEQIEYSPTAIYSHFADKETLMRELCAQDFERLAETFQSVVEISDPVERLRETGRAYVEFALRNPNLYRFMFMTPRPPDFEPDVSKKGDIQQDAYAMVVAVVTDAMEKGAFREDLKDPDLLAQVLWSAMHGLIALQLVGAKDKWVDWRPFDARVQLMLQATLRGILREAPRG
jgi:AcrR family transcriptional regulator